MANWSGFYNQTGDKKDHALLVDRGSVDQKLARAFRRRSSVVMRNAFDQLTTSQSIPTNLTHAQVQGTVAPGEPASGGGAVTIETVTDRASGNLTAAEVTRIDEIAQYDPQPSTYPVDKAGVGGGGKSEASQA